MEIDPRYDLPVHCPNCDETFPAPKSMKGGYSNCPRCQRAVEVTGGYEAEFWLLFGLGCVVCLLISAAAFWGGGIIAGGITLGIGVLIMTCIILAS